MSRQNGKPGADPEFLERGAGDSGSSQRQARMVFPTEKQIHDPLPVLRANLGRTGLSFCAEKRFRFYDVICLSVSVSVVRSPHSANIAFYRLYRCPYPCPHTCPHTVRTRSLEEAIRCAVRAPCAGGFHVK